MGLVEEVVLVEEMSAPRCRSLNFLEKRASNGRWVEDKENPPRRMLMEGRMSYRELIVRLHGAEAVSYTHLTLPTILLV